MKDERLLRLLNKDPERGVSALIDEYGGLVYAVIRGSLAGRCCETDIEACAADTFSEFYLDHAKYEPSRGSLKAWLCVIAKHNAADCLRRAARQAGNIPIDEAAELIPDDFSIEGDFEDRSVRAKLVAAVNALGEPDREIIVRKFFLSQPSKLIAQRLGMTVSNVDTRTHRAIKKLREQFGGEL